MNRDRVAGPPPSLSFVGAGRAASALAVAARSAGYEITAITSRTRHRAEALATMVGARAVPTPLAAVRLAEITVVAVPDGAIPGVAATVAACGAALDGRSLVHTAARLGPEALAAARLTGAAVGVLHPLQALTGSRGAALIAGSYFRVEAEGQLRQRLETLVAAMGGQLIAVSADARAAYHAAAVLAGNAPLTLLAAAERILQDAGVEQRTAHAALTALLLGAATNALSASPEAALTGPIARGDAAAVRAHLEALQSDPGARDLYISLAAETARLAGRDAAALGIQAPAPRQPLVRRVA
ncbi:MAG TPA: DUF2520 domain-containing protein [Candidatus Dormibacteraeota bacterium]